MIYMLGLRQYLSSLIVALSVASTIPSTQAIPDPNGYPCRICTFALDAVTETGKLLNESEHTTWNIFDDTCRWWCLSPYMNSGGVNDTCTDFCHCATDSCTTDEATECCASWANRIAPTMYNISKSSSPKDMKKSVCALCTQAGECGSTISGFCNAT